MALNTEHKVTLTESQISIVLYCLDDYMSRDKSNDPDLPAQVDAIYEELEGSVDKFYNKVEKAKSKQPVAEWQDTYISVTANVDLPIISIIMSTYTTEDL